MDQKPQSEITLFAKTNFRNRQVPFGIKTDDRRRHMYVIGKTGMGKTTLMENMVIQDIRAGRGVCFIDPHGDSVVKILDFIPNDRVNDVIYVNPADLDFPIAFNILEAVETKYKHLVASGLMGVFTKIWANLWSARMEYILNNTILALLESPGNTMLGIVRMYVDKKYRKKIIDNVKDPMVKSFWIDEFANYNEKYRTEAIAPIQNKVGQFLSSSIIRNIVGQPKSTLDLRSVMDNKKILLLDLSKGKVGEDNSALLGAMIITKLQLAALSRVDIPEHERQDFYLYVDEFQNFVTDSFATILSEARKYHLNLIIGHQYIGQLMPDKNNVKVRDAVFGNVGTMVVFRVGAADAEFLETEFEPMYTPNDIVNLPKAQIVLKLMINGVTSEPFSATTLPPIQGGFTGNKDKVIKVSRERYANPAEEVEEKIGRWMGAEFHEQTALLVGNNEVALTPEAPEVPINSPEDISQNDANSTPTPELLNTVEQAKEIKLETSQTIDSRPKEQGTKISNPQELNRLTNNPKPDLNFEQKGTNNSQTNNTSNQRTGRNPRKRHKPKKIELKNENPIWDLARTIEKDKSLKKAEDISQIVEKAFKADRPKPPEPVQNSDSINPQILKPGETHKF
jgi:hypothetical protein